ncbi:uncharacterized protein [Halyomorpha halys]|uniref:uncharacterized protein n=1 Tax=Halyomorpha halys TaxID=286706 RepID=UPI000D0C86DB|nr:uncharacterized protein LOC112211146 [Halyomorpha halys]
MGFLGIKLLLCVFLVSCTVKENNGDLVRQKRFISLLTQSANIITNGIQQQSAILNQGIQQKQAIISQVPALVKQTSQAIQDSFLRAAEIPATVAANLLLNGANAYIITTKKETINLPEINTSVLGFGRFVANGGRLRNLSTMISNGQVRLQKSGLLALTIDVPVRLGNLSVEYDNYTFRTWGINLNGAVKVTIGKNAFLLKLELLGAADCTINVQRVELQTLEDINVELQGSFASFLKSATNYIAKFLQDMIKTEVQKALDEQLSTYVNNNGKLICSRFTQLNLP